MTRLMQCGWETGDVQQLGAAAGVGGATTPVIAATNPTPRSGGFCLKCSMVSNNSGWASGSRWTYSHVSKTELYYAFALYRNQAMENNGSVPSHFPFFVQDTAGNVNAALTIEYDGTMRAYACTGGGSGPNMSTNFALLATSSTAVPATTWVLIEIHLIASTTTTGTFEVRLNGTTVISVTGVRTAQTNANYGAFNLQQSRVQLTNSSSASYFAFDDVRVNDTLGSVNNSWLGDEKIVMLVPNGAGDSTQLTRGGADSGANWSQVDEVPPTGLSDYVYSNTAGQMDLYNVTAIPVASVSAVNVIVQAFNSDGGGGSVYLVTKTPAGQSDGSAQQINVSPLLYQRLLEADPADAGTWTQAKIDALQLGMKIA